MTESLRALLTGAIDYAGLFPPASLQLEPSISNFAEYVRSDDAWMLGAFVLPLEKFSEAEAYLPRFDPQHRFRISALGKKTASEADFREELRQAAETIRTFAERHGTVAEVTQLELPLPAEGHAQEAFELPCAIFLEAPADHAQRTIERLAGNSARIGFKVRTGGVVAAAFPSAMQIAQALSAAAEHRVPIKFAAGLHHPIRSFHESVQTKMHGFLNVLGAGVLTAEYNWDASLTAEMLDDEDPASFVFADEHFSWREWRIPAERIRAQRELITSLGSCSFDEPRDDLRALNLL